MDKTYAKESAVNKYLQKKFRLSAEGASNMFKGIVLIEIGRASCRERV